MDFKYIVLNKRKRVKFFLWLACHPNGVRIGITSSKDLDYAEPKDFSSLVSRSLPAGVKMNKDVLERF